MNDQEIKLSELEKRMDLRFESANQALDLAERALTIRLEGMNNFREQLRAQAADFVTRREVELKIEAMEKSRRDLTSLGISVIGLITAIASVLIRLR